MRPFARRTIQVAVMVGGFGLLGVGAAHADTTTSGPTSSPSETPIHATVDVCDNHVAAAGSPDCVSSPSQDDTPSGTSSDSSSSQDATGSAGDSDGGSSTDSGAVSGGTDTSTTGSGPGASRTQQAPEPPSGSPLNPVVNAPVDICGNTVAVIEDGSQSCDPTSPSPGTGDNSDDGDGDPFAGNQINPVINAPIVICGNSVGILADAQAECSPRSEDPSASTGNTTTGDDGLLSGNQINPVVNAPIVVCGNAVGVGGNASAQCDPTGHGTGVGDNSTSGDGGVISGNQINPVANLPITICGNAISVLGHAEGTCTPSDQGIGMGTVTSPVRVTTPRVVTKASVRATRSTRSSTHPSWFAATP